MSAKDLFELPTIPGRKAVAALVQELGTYEDVFVQQAHADMTAIFDRIPELCGLRWADKLIPPTARVTELGRQPDESMRWLAPSIAPWLHRMPRIWRFGVTKAILFIAEPSLFKAEYQVWYGMNRRCADLTNKDYGGRDISVCLEWQASFFRWYLDMNCPRPYGRSIDRVNNDGNYEPSNCRWATAKEQSWNQRRTHKTELCQLSWCDDLYKSNGLCERHETLWKRGGIEALLNEEQET